MPPSLSDKQWEVLGPMIPLASLEGRPPTVERREIESVILYVLRSGCPWRLLPHEFPAWGTVYYSFRRWEREGVWKQILQSLRMEMRQKEGRNAEPSAAGISSQSIKTSAVRGPEKGYDAGKKNWGRKRHEARLIRKAICWRSKCSVPMAPISTGRKCCWSR